MFDDFLFDDESALATLEVLRSDAPAEERAEAAIRLGPILEIASEGDDPDLSPEVGDEVAATVRALYEDEAQPTLVRRRCLESSVRWLADWHADAVRNALDTPGDWRITGLFCAGYVPGFTEELRVAALSSHEDEAVEALLAIGNGALSEVGTDVVSVAEDEGRPQALGTVDDAKGRAFELLDDLTSDGDPDIAEAAEEALEERSLLEDLELVDDED